MKKQSTLENQVEQLNLTFQRRLNQIYNLRWNGSQADFAKAIDEVKKRKGYHIGKGCKPQYISKWLKVDGKNIPEDINLECICEVLDVDPEYFELRYYDDQASRDTNFILEENRKFDERLKGLGIRPGIMEFIRSDDLFSTKFPFNPEDKVKYFDEEHIPSLKKYVEDVSSDYSEYITMSSSDLYFIKEIQEEVDRAIDRMYWNKFEEYRIQHIKKRSREVSERYGLPVDTIIKQYEENPDWFIRTKVNLREQIKEDNYSLESVVWNYVVEKKIEIPESVITYTPPVLDFEFGEELQLLHIDSKEWQQLAIEKSENVSNGIRERMNRMNEKINEAIMNGTAKKARRRK